MLHNVLKRLGFKHDSANDRYRYGNEHFIDLRNLVKTYQSAAGAVHALKDINLQVNAGEFVAVVGKSGSGKTTLMNMLTGIDRPTSGEVFVGDTAVHTLGEDRSAVWRGKQIGIVYQFFQLMPTLTVVENVMLPMDFGDIYPTRQFYKRAIHLLDQVGIAEHAHKLPSAVSGGQQQRVAIARALANDPPLIVADEPTGNLDSQTADAVFRLFAMMIDEGKTILLVTHDGDLAQRVQRTITITDGEIVDDDRLLTRDQRGAQPDQRIAPDTTTAPSASAVRDPSSQER